MDFDVAISYCGENHFYAINLYEILRECGLSVYCSGAPQFTDAAGGNLRKELRNIYQNSSVNILLWSQDYLAKIDSDSVIKMEHDLLFSRHVARVSYKSLYIYRLDSTPVSDDFEDCLSHKVDDVTFLSARSHIVERIIDSYSHDNDDFLNLEHPGNVLGHRGPMKPCTFRLSSNFKQDGLGRWESLGDCLVVPMYSDIDKKNKTYLLPSKQVPSFLSHSVLLRTSKPARSLKKRLTMEFVKRNRETTFGGVLFYITGDGHEYPHIYCSAYDHFLIKHMHKV